MCFETLFHCASSFPVRISRYVQFKIPSKLANCHPFLSPPRSNMEPEDYLSEEERKSAYQSLHSECSMLGFQDYNISKLKPISDYRRTSFDLVLIDFDSLRFWDTTPRNFLDFGGIAWKPTSKAVQFTTVSIFIPYTHLKNTRPLKKIAQEMFTCHVFCCFNKPPYFFWTKLSMAMILF